ncbi:MAG: acetylglutamate kinase [Lachnospiraceae bacterium]
MSDYIIESLSKAQTLIEALPYIQEFNNKIVVVKYGGSAMLDPELKMNVIKDVALLKYVGMHPVIVHGGGKEISKWVSLLGHEAVFVEGLRVTDDETMEVAEMVLSKVNKSLVQMLGKMGVKAAGISGKDGGMLNCKKKYANGKDIGFVGNITDVNTDIIDTLIENDYVPVIAPIGMDAEGQSYNINADDAACAIAAALGAEKLAFLTDIEGVYKDPENPETLISELSLSDAEKLINEGYVGGGMVPKLRNCIESVKNGVSRVHIIDGRCPHCLLLEFFTRKGIGTAIIDDRA